MTDLSTIRLFATQPHSCSYLENKHATTLFVDPNERMDAQLYKQLSELGFRRSGGHVYRPKCESCQACVAARIPVSLFEPNRQQRRCWKRNQDLSIQLLESIDSDEHYQLYECYIAERHQDGDMYPASRSQFRAFLTQEWNVTRFIELRLEGKLVAVVVCDQMENALSAVYTYYDPNLQRRSLGSFAILLQIERAKELGLKYIYLGYWIKACPKMSYKTQFRPLELMVNKHWSLIR